MRLVGWSVGRLVGWSVSPLVGWLFGTKMDMEPSNPITLTLTLTLTTHKVIIKPRLRHVEMRVRPSINRHVLPHLVVDGGREEVDVVGREAEHYVPL